MIVGIFTDDFFPIIWGQWMHVYSLYQEIVKKWELHNFLFFSPSDNNLDNHVRIYAKSRNHFLKNFALSVWLHFNIKKIVQQYELTHVHIHWWPWWLFLIRKLPIPVIVTCHHTYWQQIHYLKSEFWKFSFLYLERITYRLCDKIIAVSSDTKKRLQNKYWLIRSKIVVIPNWIDKSFWLCKSNNKRREKQLLYIWRVDKRKWTFDLVKMFVEFSKENKDYSLLVAWKWPHISKIEKYINQLDGDTSISMLWFIWEEEKRSLLDESEILIVPSLFEWFGIVVLEWLCRGCKIVAKDTDWLAGLVTNKENLYSDYDSFAKSLLASSKNWSIKILDWKEVYQETKQVYEQLA